MMSDKKDLDKDKAARDAANIKLAIGLGLFAVFVYFGFIYLQYMKSMGAS